MNSALAATRAEWLKTNGILMIIDGSEREIQLFSKSWLWERKSEFYWKVQISWKYQEFQENSSPARPQVSDLGRPRPLLSSVHSILTPRITTFAMNFSVISLFSPNFWHFMKKAWCYGNFSISRPRSGMASGVTVFIPFWMRKSDIFRFSAKSSKKCKISWNFWKFGTFVKNPSGATF